jgi:hypothetical protein
LLAASLLLTSGCQVGRTFFQMDSDAPVPFFGMDLLPRRSTASPTDGVSRFQDSGISRAAPPSNEQTVISPLKAPFRRKVAGASGSDRFALPTQPLRDGERADDDAPVELFR